MTPAEYMAIGAVIVGAIETIIALLPIKPNSQVELAIAFAKMLLAPYRRG
jgi:hypothetical protein